ncbi:MAG: hypothetical protein ACI9O6_003517 [Glaciecola sp.]|jgi:hypothetical protein
MESTTKLTDDSAEIMGADNKSKIKTAQRVLSWSGKAWLSVLVLCQMLFILYLIAAYAMPSISGDLAKWNGNSGGAFIAGDTLGNIAFGMHVLLAIVMIAGGPLQLIPRIRNKYRRFHRINGRLYVFLALTISFVGIYMIWTRGTVGNLTMHSLTTFNGLVTIICGFLAFAYARARNIAVHQIWATRLFIVANGVLYFRIILFGFLVLFGPVGIDFQTFTGPTVLAISVISYVFPIVFYELYRRASNSNNSVFIYSVTGSLAAITVYFMLGTFAVTMGSWLPVIQ